MHRQTIDLGGPVRYLDFGGEGRSIVLVHGLGGSAENWLGVAPGLSGHGRVLALDLAGFGHTPAAGRASSLHSQRALLDRFLQRVAGPRAVLVGNSMGGLLSLMEASQKPERVGGLVLVNAALPWLKRAAFDPRVWAFFAALLTPGLAGRYLKTRSRQLGAEGIVRQTLEVVAADFGAISPELVRAHVELTQARMDMPWADEAVIDSARSLLRTLMGERVYAYAGHVKARTLVVHGELDRLIPVEAARDLVRRRPDWPLAILPGLGHVPMLEAPELFLETLVPWLDALDPAIAV